MAPLCPEAVKPQYYDILAGKTGCAAVVLDWNHYGACFEGVAPTLARVTKLAAQGCDALNLDLYGSDLNQTMAFDTTAMSSAQQVVDRAASIGVVTLVGPSKGDVTMSDGVPTTATTGQLVALATQFVGNKNVDLNAGGLPANNGFQTATGCQLSAASGLGRIVTLRAMRLPQELDGPSWRR